MRGDIFIDTSLPDGSPAVILVRKKTVDRLAKTCFRGKHKALAGNFCLWDNAKEMLADPHNNPHAWESIEISFGGRKNHSLHTALLDTVQDIVDSEEERTYWRNQSVIILVGAMCGWSSTDDRHSYREYDLETFQPNRHSTAKRVLRSTGALAPLTDIVTLKFEIKLEQGTGWVVVIHSAYPGADIGKLSGDITKREKVVFFDWNHPGAEHA